MRIDHNTPDFVFTKTNDVLSTLLYSSKTKIASDFFYIKCFCFYSVIQKNNVFLKQKTKNKLCKTIAEKRQTVIVRYKAFREK